MRRLIAALVFCLLNIPVRAEDCVASVYAVGDSSQPRTKTASGIPLNDNVITAAHKSLPFGSKVKVTTRRMAMPSRSRSRTEGPMLKAAALICPRPVQVPLDLPDLFPSASCL
jgi:rare lipoprotein A